MPVGGNALDFRYYLQPLIRRILRPLVSTGELDRRFRRADEISETALSLLRSAKRLGSPIFMTVNYMDTHIPYLPPPPYDRLYPGKDLEMNLEDLHNLRQEVSQLHRSPTAGEFAYLTSQYDGAMAFLDAEFQRLMDGLRETGLYDSTLVILTADHGEALGERNLMEHAVSVYQNQVHIPLVVKYPNQVQGAVVTTPVSAVDIMPTVLEAAQIQPSRALQGRTLRQPDESRFIISESFRSGLLSGWHPRFDRVERAIVKGPLKLIQSTAGKHEMYDLSADPEETRNLYGTNSETASELSRLLTVMLAGAPPDRAPAGKLGKEILDRLRSLGYVQ
jgi:arylsulfatase A-like enzyme